MQFFQLDQLLLFAATGCVFVLIYTYAIFPLCMALIGYRRSNSPLVNQHNGSSDQSARVSLIIPAFNEEAVIADKIQNSLAIDTANLEIIVASDGSTDRTNELCSAEPRIRLIAFDKRRGKSSALNDAVSKTNGDFLCFCDANVMFERNALNYLLSHFADPDVGGVTGDVRLKSEASSFGRAERLYYQLERSIHRGESRLGAVIGVDGGMYVIRRNLFHELPADTILDDFSISMNILRQGKKLLYDQRAIANENATELAADEFRRRVRIGIGAAQAIGRGIHPRWSQLDRMFLFISHKLLRWISPWLIMTVLVAATMLAPTTPIAWFALAPTIAVISLSFLGALFPGLRQLSCISLPFYFVLSQFAFALGTTKVFFVRPTGIWRRTERRLVGKET